MKFPQTIVSTSEICSVITYDEGSITKMRNKTSQNCNKSFRREVTYFLKMNCFRHQTIEQCQVTFGVCTHMFFEYTCKKWSITVYTTPVKWISNVTRLADKSLIICHYKNFLQINHSFEKFLPIFQLKTTVKQLCLMIFEIFWSRTDICWYMLPTFY